MSRLTHLHRRRLHSQTSWEFVRGFGFRFGDGVAEYEFLAEGKLRRDYYFGLRRKRCLSGGRRQMPSDQG